MDSFLQNLGNKVTHTTSDTTHSGQEKHHQEQPQQHHQEQPQQHHQQQPHHKASPTGLLSDAKLVAEAAQAALNHDTSKIDKAKVAGAAQNILDTAQEYAKLDEKGMGKYVDKAEEYLHKYSSSASGGTGSAGAHLGEHPHSDPKNEGHSKGGGGGIGDYAKMAQGFFKKE